MRPLRLIFSAAVLAAGVAGCSGSGAADVQEPIATVAPTASAEASVIATETPVADERSVAGAERFVRGYLDALNLAYATGDVSQLRLQSATACVACMRVVESVESVRDGGGTIQGGQVQLVTTILPEGVMDANVSVLAVVNTTRYSQRDAAGVEVTSQPSVRNADLQFTLTWLSGSWLVEALAVGKQK